MAKRQAERGAREHTCEMYCGKLFAIVKLLMVMGYVFRDGTESGEDSVINNRRSSYARLPNMHPLVYVASASRFESRFWYATTSREYTG